MSGHHPWPEFLQAAKERQRKRKLRAVRLQLALIACSAVAGWVGSELWL